MRGFVYVIHYFNPQGAQRFPAIFQEHQRRAAQHEGFVSLRYLRPTGTLPADGTFTLLEFADEQLMRKWRASEDHKWVAAQYSALWAKDPHVQIFLSDQ